MVWTHGIDTLLEFIDNANRLHPIIKFTYSFSTETVNFLDTTVHLINNHIETELYTKPTDPHQYLLFSSCHPRHSIQNIPKSLALRIKRICSTGDYFKKHATCLTSYLFSRSYKEKHIRKITDEVRTLPRKNLLKSTPKSASEKTSFITTFHPRLPKFNSIFNKFKNLLSEDFFLKAIFPKKRRGLIDGLYRRNLIELSGI